MLFEFTRRSGAPTVFNDGATFHVDQISRFGEGAGAIDVSHLIDRSYGYHSPRELRWHLAERFGLTPNGVALREAH
ncbi:AsnC family transcriptional regulator [Methylobacterium sp. JK268]